MPWEKGACDQSTAVKMNTSEKELLGDGQVSVEDGDVERRFAVLVGVVDVRTVLNEQVDDVCAPVIRSHVERRLLVRVVLVHMRAWAQQKTHDVHVPEIGRLHRCTQDNRTIVHITGTEAQSTVLFSCELFDALSINYYYM